MRLFVASVVCVLLALSFPVIESKLEKSITTCGDFFFEGESPVIPGILENSEPQNNDYKVICQKYRNNIRYATLYDTVKKIPVFSAYKYTGTKEFVKPEIPQTWMTELQLEPIDAEMHEPFVKQARNKDYWIKAQNYLHGTLFSVSHTADEETAESTLTLTNCVPHANGFWDGIWNVVEKTTKKSMDESCRDNNDNIVAYVMTGAVPGNNMLNKRVKVPTDIWTAFCCYNSAKTLWVSKAYYTGNKKKTKVTSIKLKSLEDLQKFLNTKLGTTVKLFKNNCSNKSL